METPSWLYEMKRNQLKYKNKYEQMRFVIYEDIYTTSEFSSQIVPLNIDLRSFRLTEVGAAASTNEPYK